MSLATLASWAANARIATLLLKNGEAPEVVRDGLEDGLRVCRYLETGFGSAQKRALAPNEIGPATVIDHLKALQEHSQQLADARRILSGHLENADEMTDIENMTALFERLHSLFRQQAQIQKIVEAQNLGAAQEAFPS